MFRKSLSVMLAVVMMMGVFASCHFTVNAQESDTAEVGLESTGYSSLDGFINDSRWTNGAYWPGNKMPIIASFHAWGCCAYCADYVKYCYGYNNPRTGSAFYSVSEIRAGDVLTVGNQSDGSGHWFICLKRSGNSLYVAEGSATNDRSHVRIGWNYTISGNKFAEDSRGFTAGYHYLDGNPEPDNLRVSVTGSQAYLNWDWDGNADYYNVKLWRGKVWEGDPYRVVWTVKSNNYGFALPKGTYQAYVDACNDNSGYCKMSNVTTFTINDVGVTLNVGIDGNQAYFSWNSDNSSSYSLKVFKDFTWDGEHYENIQPLKQTYYGLALPKGRYQAYVDCNNSMSNVVDFTIEDATPKLSANVQGNQVYFNWNADKKARSYNLKIYKGHVWQVDAYEIINGITDTSKGVALPRGTYQAYVDAVGDNYLHMGSVIEFVVTDASPTLFANVVGNQVSFSWDSDNNASKYNLRIYKGHVWQSDVYETINDIETTDTAVALPAGTYQAYIDAVGDNYLHMGNVIEFTVGNAEPVLSAKVVGNQIDFSWTKDSKAKSYSLKIWNGYAWRVDAYLVKENLVDTKETVMLPKGNYQAYVDAFEDNNTVMGNVIDIVVLDDNYVEPTPYTLGDADGSGDVDIVDATVIQRHECNMTVPYSIEVLMNGDVDGDGELTVLDATFIQRFCSSMKTPYKIGEPIT